MSYKEQKEILELQIEVYKLYLKCLDKEQNAPKPSWYYTQFPPMTPSTLGPVTCCSNSNATTGIVANQAESVKSISGGSNDNN